jgi:hypothetical protein
MTYLYIGLGVLVLVGLVVLVRSIYKLKKLLDS